MCESVNDEQKWNTVFVAKWWKAPDNRGDLILWYLKCFWTKFIIFSSKRIKLKKIPPKSKLTRRGRVIGFQFASHGLGQANLYLACWGQSGKYRQIGVCQDSAIQTLQGHPPKKKIENLKNEMHALCDENMHLLDQLHRWVLQQSFSQGTQTSFQVVVGHSGLKKMLRKSRWISACVYVCVKNKWEIQFQWKSWQISQRGLLNWSSRFSWFFFFFAPLFLPLRQKCAHSLHNKFTSVLEAHGWSP